MKKATILTSLLFIFIVSACSLPEKTTTYELDDDGIVTTIIFTHKGDKVIEDTEKTIMPYALVGFASQAEARETLDYLIDEFKDIEGLKYRIDYTDTEAIETLTIDYLTVDFEEIKDIVGLESVDGDEIKYISLSESIKMIESEGMTKVE